MTTDLKPAETQNPASPRKKRLRSRSILVTGLICLPVIAFWTFAGGNSAEVSVTTQNAQSDAAMGNEEAEISADIPVTAISNEASAEPAPISDETYRQRIVGRWETDRDGMRHLTVSEDGTAVMDVQIPGNWSLLFGEKLHFDIVWSIEDGMLTFETTGGTPKAKVDLITSMYGKKRVQEIKQLDDATMRLPDEDPETEDHVWTRVEPAESRRQ